MKPFDKCPICGGQLLEKEVEKLLGGTPYRYFEGSSGSLFAMWGAAQGERNCHSAAS